MPTKTHYGRISLLNGTAEWFSTNNPLLLKGELGFETDTNKAKIGDGTTYYNDLKYLVDIDTVFSEYTYTNSTEMLIEVGGYEVGTTFDNQTLKQVLDGLFYPYIAPTISATSSPQNGGTYERNRSDLTITSVTATVTKKSRDITSVSLTDYDGSLLETKTGSEVIDGGSIVFSTNIGVTQNVNYRLTATVTDSDGYSYTAQTGSYTWVYPFFYGVTELEADEFSSFDDINQSKSVTSKGSKTFTYTTDNNRAFIAYPSSYGSLSKITDGSGVTDYTNAFSGPASISVTSSDYGWTNTYYVYTSGRATATNFSYIFTF